jgi:hypothetical protein
MADIIEFEGKKDEKDFEDFLTTVLEGATGNAGDNDMHGASSEKVETGKDNLIHLPKESWPQIDWQEIEAIRKAEYPRIPKKALAIIQLMFENPGDDSYFDIQDFEDGYPPDPVPIRPTAGDAVWLMDLLDRFGGEVRFGNRKCVIKRKKRRPAVFLIQPISLTMREALVDSIGPLFEHYLASKSWVIWGKK